MTVRGGVRDALAYSVSTWLAALHRAVVQAKEEGHLHADADEAQIAFEIHGLILAAHYEARFLKNPGATERASMGFENILARYGQASPKSSSSELSGSPQSTPHSQE